MRPLSGMLLYINLGFAIIWDSLGFLLFIIGLIPGIQAFAVVASPVVDVLAFLTDLTFCILYQGYVKLYNVNFRVYQIKRIKEMLRLSKSSGASNNPISQNLARQTQKLNKYMTDKFSNYVVNFTVKKIQYSILTSTVEIIPWLGDLSPSWTIKANLHLREHRKTARELKIRTLEFEQSLAKWRGSLRIGGVRRLTTQSNNINSKSVRETAANNIVPFRRRLPSETSQSLRGQKNISLDARESAANNIVPFSRKVVGEGSQPRSGQNNKLANVKSAAGNIASVGRQLVGSIPQSLEYEDDNLRDPKLPNNKTSPNDKKLINSGGRYMQSQNNSTEKPKGERLAGERAQAVIYPQDINPTIRETAANNIRPFNRKKTAGSGGQSTPRQKDINLDWKKSAAGNIASVGRQLAGSIPQSREYEDEELQYRKSSANKNKPSKTQVFSDISKPVQAQNNNNEYTNNISAANNIKKFNRDQQNEANSEQILETLIKK